MTDINLSGMKFRLRRRHVACVGAHWWTEDATLVIVDFEERRSRDQFSLCLDLDKGVFMDHVDNTAINPDVQSKTIDIWKKIIAVRTKLTEEQYLKVLKKKAQ